MKENEGEHKTAYLLPISSEPKWRIRPHKKSIKAPFYALVPILVRKAGAVTGFDI